MRQSCLLSLISSSVLVSEKVKAKRSNWQWKRRYVVWFSSSFIVVIKMKDCVSFSILVLPNGFYSTWRRLNGMAKTRCTLEFLLVNRMSVRTK